VSRFLVGFLSSPVIWYGISYGFRLSVWGTEFLGFVCRGEIAPTENEWQTHEAVYNVCSGISKRILTEPSSATRLTFSYVIGRPPPTDGLCLPAPPYFWALRLLLLSAINCSNRSSDKFSCKRRSWRKVGKLEWTMEVIAVDESAKIQEIRWNIVISTYFLIDFSNFY